jgi:hypothetical protein
MRFARWVFLVAGIFGVLLVLPMYLLEAQIGRDLPPAITHPEYYYGFLGVALACQLLFLIVARDPHRYRAAMLVGVVEKASYGIAALVLFTQGRLSMTVFSFGVIDLIFGILFVVAFVATAHPHAEPVGRAASSSAA